MQLICIFTHKNHNSVTRYKCILPIHRIRLLVEEKEKKAYGRGQWRQLSVYRREGGVGHSALSNNRQIYYFCVFYIEMLLKDKMIKCSITEF